MTNDEKIYCVYKHTSPSGKVYIGITCQSPEKRWANGYGYNQVGQEYFWNAICKYGWENFEHEILYDNLTYDDAIQYEIDLIALYKSNYKRYGCDYGYNATDGGEGRRTLLSQETKNKISQSRIGRFTGEDNPNYGNHKLAGENNPFYGKKHSEETKRKLSESSSGRPSPMKGKTMSEESKQKLRDVNKERSKPVLQFNLDGELINEYSGVHNASILTGYNASNISSACNGKIHVYKNSIWMFKSDYTPGQKVEPTKRKQRVNKKHKAVSQYTTDNTFVATYVSANEAECVTGIRVANIRACCNCEQKTAGGFIWRYNYNESN